MFLATASTKRPIAMTCLLIALVALGLNSYRKLSLEDLPAVDIPYVTVITQWVGASPEDIEKDVTKYIEDGVSGIDGLKHVMSSNLENVSQVVLEFELGVDVDIAAQDVREKLDPVLADLPAGAERPVIQKISINEAPVVNLFLSGDVPVDALYDYADNTVADNFATVRGVARVDVVGGNEREVWVELDRARLVAAGLTASDVANALRAGVLSLPGGRLREGGMEYAVRFDAEYAEAAELEGLEVAGADGARVLLRDVATVRMATEEVRQRVLLDGKPGVAVKIVKKSEGNTVEVVRECRERFDAIAAALPGGMAMTWVSDESASVVESVNSALSSVWLAILICAIVLFVFLVNVRTTVIVAITMPVTVTISLFFMRLWGQSLNTVTLLAIGLSTGVLVSNSIVVLENIVSKFETMDDHWEAARQGASEVTVAVLASAGTNVIVMLPISMMWSLVGKILAPFAITTLVVNAVSILISFTLTPILCAMLLQPASKRKVNAFSRLGRRWEVAFQRLASHYARWLRAVFDHRVVCVAVAVGFVAVFMLTMKFGGARVGFTFFETDDVGRVFIRVELPPYSNLALTEKRLEAIQGRLMEFSDLEHVMTTVGVAEAFGGQAREGVYMGQIELFFKSKLERDWTIHQRLQEIRDLLADETDCLVSASVTGKMGGQSLPIEYSLSGPDLAVLEDTARAIRDVGRRVPGVGMFETTVRDPKPELRIVPKRAVLADLGVSAATLGALVRANIDGVEAASYKRGDRTYDIRVKLGEVPGKEQVRQFMLPGRDGKPIPLESVADVVDDHALLQVYRVDKRRAVVLLGDLVPGATLSRVGEGILAAVERENLIPPGYEFKTAGDSEMLGDAVADFGEAILLGTFLTVLLLSAMLESWTRPGIVLLTLPMGLIGVVASLAITGLAITILTLLGILMLIGIVVNAAILIVERMGQLEAEGMTKREALVVSMHDQFRPALMLILASGLGMLPIALSTGIGSENRMGIGVASVGGILVAGLFTLTVLPVVVSLFTRGERPQGR